MANQAEGTLFEVHLTGNVTGKTWDGKFRAKPVLSFAEQARGERILRDILGPGPYDGMDIEVIAAARMLSVLSVRITEAPEWWGGGANHADTNLLMAVYAAADKVVKEHLDEVQKKGETARASLREDRPEFVRPPPTPVPGPGRPSAGS
jgi:hypothetical protein